MIKNKKNLGLKCLRHETIFIYLAAIFVGGLIIANIIGSKVISLGPLLFPAGVLAYSITFPISDTIAEVWGKKRARHVVWAGFVANLIAAGLVWLAITLPSASVYEHSDAFKQILGNSFRIILASLVAYLTSQHHDIWTFDFLKKKTKGKYLWLRNNLSTATSQFIDTIVFVSIAFVGVIPLWSLVAVVLGQYLIKVAIAAIDTPFVYLLVHFLKPKKNVTK